MPFKDFLKPNPDALGIAASLLCAAHCILLPVLFTSLPLLGVELLRNPLLELATIVLSMGIGVWVLWRGYRQGHIRRWMVAGFIAGLTLVTAGNFMDTTIAEALLKFSGATLIVTVHAINWRQHRRRCEVHKH
ncbi:MerC domain-containing protein [Chitinophaga parva]|uniref:MerC domain-containing protein n=1 Tax=Chitinophaga parva TaxID=2169414 RepID=A0A2T7BCW2_9BACT|nr:MerC domain-containing protein [Chitinophaga parva]PUZ22915.1 MerC domain-containing protein [Chitinophaga parva]